MLHGAAEKLEACEGQVAQGGARSRFSGTSDKKQTAADQQLHKICCDANKLALEHIKGVSAQARTGTLLSTSLDCRNCHDKSGMPVFG